MRNGILAAGLMLVVGTAGAGPGGDNGDDAPISRQAFHSVARAEGIFERVDRNGDGVIDQQEFRAARLPQGWEQWAGSDERIDANEFYDRAFDAYREAARAVRAFPRP